MTHGYLNETMKQALRERDWPREPGRCHENPYHDIACRTGLSVARVVELASQGRLGELFHDGKLIGEIPQTPRELRAAVERLRPPQTGLPGRLARQLVEVRRLREPASSGAATHSSTPKRVVSVVRDSTGNLVPLKVEY
jgi:hypothetical protein